MAKEKDRHKNPNYVAEYKRAKYDSIQLQYNHERRYKERVKAQADDEGLSITAWILRAIDRELDRESGIGEE